MDQIYSLIVIGAGAAGLVCAIGAAKAGKKVLLIDRGTWGGDCTNFGCIPSKSLIASSRAAYMARNLDRWGLTSNPIQIDGAGAFKRAREIVAEIRAEEDPEALLKKGVETLKGTACFLDPHTLDVDGVKVRGKKIVIATGSKPRIPPIAGLDQVPYLTNETIFDLTEVPKKLAVIGGGPIGCELAQSLSRLGSEVVIIQHEHHLLEKEELQAQNVIEKLLVDEGITLYLNHEVCQVLPGIKLKILDKNSGGEKEIGATHLLVAAGRQPSTSNLNLQAANIRTENGFIKTDAFGRTSQKHIFAIGDVTGEALFTHVAENRARTVLTNLILPWPFHFRFDRSQSLPRVTYTDPEVASAGLSEEQAIETFGYKKIATYRIPFNTLDRAKTTGEIEGYLSIVTKKWSSKILGVTIVSSRAGEMLQEVTLAMKEGIPLRKLASLIHPYPTFSLAIRKAADLWLTKTLLRRG